MTRDDLEQIWAWANEKLATGKAPPWAWEQYIKLCETLDAISAGLALATVPESPGPAPYPRARLRLVVDNGAKGKCPPAP